LISSYNKKFKEESTISLKQYLRKESNSMVDEDEEGQTGRRKVTFYLEKGQKE